MCLLANMTKLTQNADGHKISAELNNDTCSVMIYIYYMHNKEIL